MNSIIIYYSKSGKTELVANDISTRLGCEKIKLETEEVYGGYLASVIKAGKDMRKGVISKVTTPVPNLDGYDTLFVGFPIWYGSLPTFVTDFLKKCELKGKRIIPFSTSTATGINNAVKTLVESFPDSSVVSPFSISRFKKDDLEAWLASLV